MAYVELQRTRPEHQQLIEPSYVDQLTGLANRRAFDSDLEREWGLALRDGVDSFVVFAHLDGFTEIGGRGHGVGDDLLRKFAQALRCATRSTDIWGRIGSREFGVLLIGRDEPAVHNFSVSLRNALAEQISPILGSVSVSLGHVSLLDSTSPAQALESAGRAMLANKRSTRSAGRRGV